jgi:hypothetical protein
MSDVPLPESLTKRVGLAFDGIEKRDVVWICTMLIAHCLEKHKDREEALELVVKAICQIWEREIRS